MKRPTLKMWKQLFLSMLPRFFYGKKKMLLAFEFGIVLSDVVQELKVPMTKEIVLRAEQVLENELKNSPQEFANMMNVLALAVLEPKEL